MSTIEAAGKAAHPADAEAVVPAEAATTEAQPADAEAVVPAPAAAKAVSAEVSPPVEASSDEDGPQTISISDDVTADTLRKEYQSFAKNSSTIVSADQPRWEMYAKIALLIKAGKIKSALKAEELLPKLKINRLKVGKVLQLLQKEGSLPVECPTMFRTGNSPATSLSTQEKMDLLSVIRFHARCSIPLSCQDVTRTIVSCLQVAVEV